MIVTRLHGNVHDSPLPAGTHVETVHLSSGHMVKRIQRLTTDHGREFGLRLPPGAPDLRDGDVLVLDESGAVVVRVEASDVLVIHARSMLEVALTAHTLGNRHLPAQFFDASSEIGRRLGVEGSAAVMVVAHDHTVVDHLTSAGVPYERLDVTLPTAFRHAEHSH